MASLAGVPLRAEDVEDYFIPVWLALVLLEIFWTYKVSRTNQVQFHDGVCSMLCGVVSRFSVLLVAKFLVQPIYTYLHDRVALCYITGESYTSMFFCLLAVDFMYYVGHRSTHEINLFWGGHKAHHSSEEYNFTTALRQGGLESLFTCFGFISLSLFFSYDVYRLYMSFNLMAQFLVHTRCVPKLWWPIEFFFNTPSHHRCHHAKNPCYIDKNYAGMFIIWDRLLGTYVEEEVEPVYGVIQPINTWSAWYANFNHTRFVLRKVWKCRSGWRTRLGILFNGPGWNSRTGGHYPIPPVPPAHLANKYATTIPASHDWYVLVHFVTVLVGISGFLVGLAHLPYLMCVLVPVWVVWTCESMAAIMDVKKYAYMIEGGRLLFSLWLVLIYVMYRRVTIPHCVNCTVADRYEWLELPLTALLAVSMGSLVFVGYHGFRRTLSLEGSRSPGSNRLDANGDRIVDMIQSGAYDEEY